jgi:succinate-semialdehyde dehydrogenase/glutarate-semialdehyde dehydrogenase
VIVSTNPATGTVVARFDPFTPEQVEEAVAQVTAAQRQWRDCPIEDRAVPLRKLAALLRERKTEYGTLLVEEMGKPLVQAEGEVEKCAATCEWYADNAATLLADQAVSLGISTNRVEFTPLGVVLAVMPWNFPFWQVFRAGAPILMAGNGMLLKHASNVPRSALALETVFADAGFPEGLFRTLLVEGGSVVEGLLADDRIAALTLTGSSEVGARLASIAGRHLKKQVLELGGSDPFIVLRDADLPYVAKAAAWARTQNNGQSCIAAKRFIVEEPVADEFARLFADAVGALAVGDPIERTTQVGPLARKDLVDDLDRQVQASRGEGATVLTGGERLPGDGFYYAPTVLDHVTPEMTVFREETFGPAAAIVRARDGEHAAELANDSPYGLGASVWSRDLEAAEAVGRRLESGLVFVNGIVASTAQLPMGGVKASGYGRELGGFGMLEFSNIRTVRVWESGTHPI